VSGCMGFHSLVSLQVFPHLTNRVHFEHLVISKKYEMRLNVHHLGGQGRFRRIVSLLQINEKRDFSIKYRNVIQNELVITFVWQFGLKFSCGSYGYNYGRF
jgi:hypothetical protein